MNQIFTDIVFICLVVGLSNCNNRDHSFDSNWKEFISDLEEQTIKDSLSEAAWTNLGKACLEYSGLVGGKTGLYDKAEESLIRALEVNEDSPDAIYYLASLYAKTGKSEASYNLFLKGSEKYPEYAKYFSGIGYVSRYAGKMQESINAYHKSIKLDSGLNNIISARMQIIRPVPYPQQAWERSIW